MWNWCMTSAGAVDYLLPQVTEISSVRGRHEGLTGRLWYRLLACLYTQVELRERFVHAGHITGWSIKLWVRRVLRLGKAHCTSGLRHFSPYAVSKKKLLTLFLGCSLLLTAVNTWYVLVVWRGRKAWTVCLIILNVSKCFPGV